MRGLISARTFAILGLAVCGWGCSDLNPSQRGVTGLPVVGQFVVTPGLLGTWPRTDLALGDCNGDGLLDLFDFNSQGRPVIKVRTPDAYYASAVPLNLSGGPIETVGTFADLDGDGHIDLILAGDEVLTLRGKGDCTFDPPVVVDAEKMDATQVHVTDVDLDGLPDIAITRNDDMEHPVTLLINRGDGQFVDRSPPATPWQMTGPYLTYGTEWDDLDGDGVRDLISIIDFKMAWMSWGIPGDQPSFQVDPTVSALVSGPCAMASAALDYNRDGTMDYFISHDMSHNTLLSFAGRKATDHATAAGLTASDRVNGTNVWSVYAFDADLDGWMDLLGVRAMSSDHSAAPAVFWHNNRDGTFTNLGAQVLPKFTSDAVSMVCGDVQANAIAICYVLPTQTGPVTIENQLESAGHWVGIRLKGTVSSPDADGALIARSDAHPPQVLYYGTQSPTRVQHDPAVVMAIGTDTETDVDVTWPSGIVQHVSGLPSGKYTTISEPQVLTVNTRVAAIGQAVDVTVSPTLIGGDAPVTIERSDQGPWTEDAPTDNHGTWTRSFLANSSAGDTRIIVTIGGKPLLVRPRVTFVPKAAPGG